MNLPFYPRISIVTPSFNQGEFIEETINSVLDQKYPNLEYIIIDGGSSDHTVSILKKYESQISYWISEPDQGQAHALNKGFSLATGDICGYLNSDDLYLPDSFRHIAAFFINTNFHWAYSYVKSGFSPEEDNYFQASINSFEQFCAQQTIGQQGVFWTPDLIQRPWFDESLKYVMDHKFFIQLYESFGAPKKLDFATSFFRHHYRAKTSTMENILYRERLKIGLEASRNSLRRSRGIKIRKEIKRLNCKRTGQKLLSKMKSELSLFTNAKFFIKMFKLFISAPYPLRDRVFLGYQKRATLILLRSIIY